MREVEISIRKVGIIIRYERMGLTKSILKNLGTLEISAVYVFGISRDKYR
jgi:hypothetical protein